jgi:hypothetical protein
MSFLGSLLLALRDIRIGGSAQAFRPHINFVSGVTATDNPTTNATDLTVSGGLYGQTTPPPTVAALTWVNQGGATATDVSAGGFDIVSPANEATDSLHCLVQNAVAAPYTFTVGVIPDFLGEGGSMHLGMLLRESATGKLITLEFASAASLNIAKYSSPTSGISGNYNSIVWTPGNSGMISPTFLRVVNDGTNLAWYVSNGGRNFVPVTAITVTGTAVLTPKNDFFTTGPDQYGVFVCALNGGTIPHSPKIALHPFHWQATQP